MRLAEEKSLRDHTPKTTKSYMFIPFWRDFFTRFPFSLRDLPPFVHDLQHWSVLPLAQISSFYHVNLVKLCLAHSLSVIQMEKSCCVKDIFDFFPMFWPHGQRNLTFSLCFWPFGQRNYGSLITIQVKACEKKNCCVAREGRKVTNNSFFQLIVMYFFFGN